VPAADLGAAALIHSEAEERSWWLMCRQCFAQRRRQNVTVPVPGVNVVPVSRVKFPASVIVAGAENDPAVIIRLR